MTLPAPALDALESRATAAGKRGNDSVRVALDDVYALCAEVRALRAVIATHDLCHNLHGKVDARAFADGCAAEQRKLYGCAPDADRVKELEDERDELLRHSARIGP